ncbi:MAG: hypothetical protein ACK5WR_20060 [Planctomycetaceae bacterium]
MSQSSTKNSSSTTAKAPSLAVYLALGVLGGLLGAWLLNRFEAQFPVIVPEDLKGAQGIFNPEQMARILNEQRRAAHSNAPLALGCMGASLAGAISLAIGASLAGVRGAIRGLVAGFILGGLLSAAGALISLQALEGLKNWNTLDSMGQPDPIKSQLHVMSHQFPTWLGIAAAIGLSVWAMVGTRGRPVQLTGAAALASLILLLSFPLMASLIHTTDTAGVIPQGFGNKLGWCLLGGVLLGGVVGRSVIKHSDPAHTH